MLFIVFIHNVSQQEFHLKSTRGLACWFNSKTYYCVSAFRKCKPHWNSSRQEFMLSSCRIWELQTRRIESRELGLGKGIEWFSTRAVKYVALTENAARTLRWQTAQGGSEEGSLSAQIIKEGGRFDNTPDWAGVIYRAQGGGESFFLFFFSDGEEGGGEMLSVS